MKIAIIQASSQKDKNELLFESVKKSVKSKGYEVVNFGIFQNEVIEYSYVEIAMLISILLESQALDFVVTGCSSGQGMMLACNSLPGILCGYVENPSDAYLFGRINNGNAISFPLGLNFGWAGELNLQSTLDSLFSEDFGTGYPMQDAVRKQKDTKLLKSINAITKRELVDVITRIDLDFMRKVVSRDNVYNYVLKYSHNEELKEILQSYR
jgi:ribose 5-phosphate isomerase RpiB